MVKIISKYKAFFIPFGVLLLISGVYLTQVSRADSHIFLNQVVTPILNPIFKYGTYLGDGNFIAGVIILLLFYRFKAATYVGLSCGLSGLFTNTLKHQFFDDVNRPHFYFKYVHPGDYMPQLVLPDAAMHIHNSFPSGHTTGAFCLFTALMLYTNKPKWAWLFFLLSFIAGFSRIYLSQHFLIDVFFGSIIGSGFAIGLYLIFEKLANNYNWNWWNKSLVKWN
jgi:membrane-associated phospholipid phosphatase